jgi:hypothetical protein
MTHTADEFSAADWTAFWRQNERQIMNYTSIFKGTIRSFEWKGQYANHILSRQLELAPAGTLKVHEFRQSTGESWEPPTQPVYGLPGEWKNAMAMANAINAMDPFQNA